MLGIPGTPSIPGDPVEAGVNLVTGGGGNKGGGSKSEASSSVSNDAFLYMSDNNKTTTLAQIQSGVMQMQQAALDREMQLAAQLELGIEKLDTRLQVSLLEYRQQMTAEENRHVEKMAQAGKGLANLQSTYSLGADLPPPEEEKEF
jgi:hypothetical protein